VAEPREKKSEDAGPRGKDRRGPKIQDAARRYEGHAKKQIRL
jgi:hypothetical protein